MPVGKVYHFDATANQDVRVGDRVIVETTRGRQIGEVVCRLESGQASSHGDSLKAIEAIATPRELAMQQHWASREPEALAACRARAAQLSLAEVKVVRAEFSCDGQRLTFLVSGGEDGARIETKSLRDDMQAQYPAQQVGLRQIGPRDMAKMLGGMGSCGLEMRCCCAFLTDFGPVGIKMAKEQGIALNPEEITGMCGRLRCCLAYENEQYAEARKNLPKRGKRVQTPKGEGKVIEVNPLKDTVRVEIPEGEEWRSYEFTREAIQIIVEPEAPKKPANPPGTGRGKNRKRPQNDQ
jgi:cell fate regulator YaaT (PSP1 superfamily)